MANELWVTGRQYYQDQFADLPTDRVQPALFVREPTNEYDPNAVMVLVADRKIGYLPRDKAARLAAIIDAKGITQLTGTIELFVPDNTRKMYAAKVTAIGAP